ncbi:MAG TPA: hypothetical protein VLG69_01940 [Candidatus Andersenbacteria bacterium]|nr:hypothetical protein [Candidatus Andersenbacteria bacterium]
MPKASGAMKRVRRGAAVLDQQCANWYMDIDLDELQLKYRETCILGQLYKRYHLGLSKLQLSGRGGISCGFVITGTERRIKNANKKLAAWHRLENCWRIVIQERLASSAQSHQPCAKKTFPKNTAGVAA